MRFKGVYKADSDADTKAAYYDSEKIFRKKTTESTNSAENRHHKAESVEKGE